MSGRGMSTAADLTSLEFDESFDAFDSLNSDFDLAWSPQNSDMPALGTSGEHPSSTRVRFTALAELHSKSLGLEGRALVTNLSPRGLSLSSSLDLDPGTRVEITIALGFAAEEVTVEAEVLWRRYRDEADTVYGMAFCEPSTQVYEEINKTIQERCEGRVVEWDLPWLPEESKVERFSWRALMLGIAVGLAGALGALGLTGSESDAVAEKPQAKGIRAIATGTTVVVETPVSSATAQPMADAMPAPVVKMEESKPALVEKNPLRSTDAKDATQAKVEPATKSVTADVASPAPSPSSANPKTQARAKPKPIESREMSAAVTEDASAVEALGPAWEAVDGGLKFRIPLDQGAEGVKWFALSEPNRLVVDVLSASTPLGQKSYEVEHAWISSLRLGRYEGKTRFVFDIDQGVVFNGDPALTASGDWVTMTFERANP